MEIGHEDMLAPNYGTTSLGGGGGGGEVVEDHTTLSRKRPFILMSSCIEFFEFRSISVNNIIIQ